VYQDAFDYRNLLEELSVTNRVAFAASCVERLIPMYTAFCLAEDWDGDPFILRRTMELVWKHVDKPSLTQSRVGELVAECEASQPDMEDYNYFLMFGAGGATPALTTLLRLCVEDDLNLVLQIQEIAVDERYFFVQRINNPVLTAVNTNQFLEEAWNSALMQAELKKQQSDFDWLRLHPTLDSKSLAEFRGKASEGGINPFERRLVPAAIIDSALAFTSE